MNDRDSRCGAGWFSIHRTLSSSTSSHGQSGRRKNNVQQLDYCSRNRRLIPMAPHVGELFFAAIHPGPEGAGFLAVKG
jgi:hypothetical protein